MDLVAAQAYKALDNKHGRRFNVCIVAVIFQVNDRRVVALVGAVGG